MDEPIPYRRPARQRGARGRRLRPSDGERPEFVPDPDYVETVRRLFEERFCAMARRLDEKGLVDRIIAVHDARRGKRTGKGKKPA